MRASGSSAVTWGTRSASLRVKRPVPAPISRASVAPAGRSQSSASGGAGAEPVVVVGDFAEGPAEDGCFLVLLHGFESTENDRWGVGSGLGRG